MFSWLENLSNQSVDADAIWLVVSSGREEGWTSLVSALAYPTGEFAFEFDNRLGRLRDSVLLRFRNSELNCMQTVPATVISRSTDRTEDLSRVRVIVDKCDCGASDCEAAVCYEAGRFVRHGQEW